jgi:hypothetical protein
MTARESARARGTRRVVYRGTAMYRRGFRDCANAPSVGASPAEPQSRTATVKGRTSWLEAIPREANSATRKANPPAPFH